MAGYGIGKFNHKGEKIRLDNGTYAIASCNDAVIIGKSIYKTWDPITSTRILKLDVRIRKPVQDFINDAYNQGIKLRITQGFRSFEEQNQLYAQGRTKPGSKVTNAKGGQSYHNYGLAVDVAPLENGEINWNGDWNRIGKTGIQHGFEWGGNFKSIIDKPHFQMTFGLKL